MNGRKPIRARSEFGSGQIFQSVERKDFDTCNQDETGTSTTCVDHTVNLAV
jgi:hypothetical protein